MDEPPKPTPEDVAAARDILEAEIEKLGRGDGSTTPERVKYLSDAFEKLCWQAQDF